MMNFIDFKKRTLSLYIMCVCWTIHLYVMLQESLGMVTSDLNAKLVSTVKNRGTGNHHLLLEIVVFVCCSLYLNRQA
jgi:hypothetical protein